MIPILDIKVIESMDNLTFSIVLHDECQMNSYDVGDDGGKKQARTTLINAFGSMLSNAMSQSQADGGFPMAFESEHVPDILQGFQKIQQKAIEKQTELNARFEHSQLHEEEHKR